MTECAFWVGLLVPATIVLIITCAVMASKLRAEKKERNYWAQKAVGYSERLLKAGLLEPHEYFIIRK